VAASSILFLLIAFLWGAGATLVHRLLRGGADPVAVTDSAIGLGLPVGLVVVGMPGWLLSALFAVPVGPVGIPAGLVVLALLAAAAHFSGTSTSPGSGEEGGWSLRSSPRRLAPAALLLGVFAGVVWLRFTMGEIRQTEKPMDFAVLEALVTTPSLPLADPWCAGERFPYYHFGSWLFSIPLRVSGIPPEIGYNLVVALLGALAAGAAFGLVRIRGGSRALGLFAALLLVFGGTFDGARQLLAGAPLGGVDVWPSSRRVLNTITEWPLFTIWLGDLHPHAVAIPFFLTLAALAGRVKGALGIAADTVLLGALLSANPWDLPAALLILGAGNLAERDFRPALLRSLATVAAGAVVLVPFLLSPHPNFQGLRTVTQKTTAPEAFLHFGALLAVPALAVGVALVRSRVKDEEKLLASTVFPAISLLVAILTQRPVLGLAIGFVLAVFYLLPRTEGALRFGFLLAACGAVMAAIPELIAVADPYGEEMHRMNTVFKCYAGAALLLAPATALLLPLPLSSRRASRTIRVVLGVALVAALVHPVSLATGRMRGKDGSLDGLRWMSAEAPGDRAAINWLRRETPATVRLIEVSGGAYSDHGRIGTFSGRPTLLGWAGHEGLWRGDAGGADVGRRQAEIKTVYTSTDLAAVREILARRQIRYVVTGPLERKEFGPDAFPLRQSFQVAFSAQGTELREAGR
jgi:YYY domain-containing protein